MMNSLLNIYHKLPHDRSLGIVSKAFNRLAARVIKRILDRKVPAYFIKTRDNYPLGINQEPREKKVIVSFTSFPARIADVWIVVECLFRQTYKADKIILWLSKPQFEGMPLPEALVNQGKRGLEIRFVEDDLRSHKKYFYTLQEHSDNVIITVDDDVYYHKNILSTLIEYHFKFPDCVIANRAHEIRFDRNTGAILPYRKWIHNVRKECPSFQYVPTGVGGVLYPANSLSVKILNAEMIKSICFQADDLWLKAGSLLTNTKIFVPDFYKQEFITIGKTQNSKLVTSNSLNGGNDIQFIKVLDYFELGNLNQYRD